jgi:hypothetical protein
MASILSRGTHARALRFCALSAFCASRSFVQKLDSTIPSPTKEELEDETSKYCPKVASGNLFVSSARQEIQVRAQTQA